MPPVCRFGNCILLDRGLFSSTDGPPWDCCISHCTTNGYISLALSALPGIASSIIFTASISTVHQHINSPCSNISFSTCASIVATYGLPFRTTQPSCKAKRAPRQQQHQTTALGGISWQRLLHKPLYSLCAGIPISVVELHSANDTLLHLYSLGNT